MTIQRLAICLAVLAMCASCASTTGTVEVPADELPFPVARQPTPTESVTRTRSFLVFFVRDGRLEAATREAQTGTILEASIRELLDGPTAEERAAGTTSELPRLVRLLGIESIGGSTVLVDLSAEFQEPALPEQVALRVAQVVWTATERAGVAEVLFAIDGEPVSVTTQDGDAVQRPLTRADYSTFAP